jgi:predicted extracellular nuclease
MGVKQILSLAVLLGCGVAAPASAQLVISQVYGGGGNSGATYNQKYVELFNRGTVAASLNGHSIQYGAAGSTSNINNKFDLPNVSIAPGAYHLVALSNASATNGAALPVTPDTSAGTAVTPAAASGKLALVNSTTALGCGGSTVCDAGKLAQIVDLVGYGTASFFEGTAAVAATSNTTAAFRAGAGCTDSNQNSTDFSVTAPLPRNASSPRNFCVPAVTIASVAQAEGNSGTSTMSFTVTLGKAASGAFRVDYATSDGSATVGDNDYVAASGTLEFDGTAGETESFTVTINGDTTSEGNESFTVTLSNLVAVSSSDAIIGIATATGTINNDDVVPPAVTPVDQAIIEGDSSTSTLSFVLNLNIAAPAGGVSVDYTTADVTATAGSDYVATSGTLSFAEGETQKTVAVTINGDTDIEGNETFELRLSNPNGLTIADAVAVGTITADDIATISQIQGNAATSPRNGQFVLTRGIVTARVNNGFFIQSQQADTDADPTTSEGLFVFTSSSPSATDVLVGNLLQVGGTVAEYIPSAEPNQQPQTQLTGPSVAVLSTGNPLPTPVTLTTNLPDPLGNIGQLEHLEGMRVQVLSLTTITGTDGSVAETSATATTNGRFSGVVTGVARPFREPGLEPEDAAGRPAGVPRFDGNPERLAIDSRRARNSANTQRAGIDVDVGAELTGVVGVLDYDFRSHRITLDFDAAPGVVGGRAPAAVAAAGATEFSIATYNMERFFDASNDPAIGEPVLSANAFTTRLAKASLAVRDFLGTPDILGAVEVENLATLQALATRINDDAVAAGQPNPQYVAYLEEGNDVGGIDVGFLVKSAAVRGATPRVAVTAVTQFGKDVLLACPDGSANQSNDRLNDRPPLLLEATVTAPNGASEDVTVIVNHLRSLNGIGDESPAAAGLCAGSNFASSGERVRQKRQQQAAFLAELVQARQQADADEHIVLVGDFNAFEFNDGWGDLIGTLRGAPTADANTVVAGDGADLVNPDLTVLQPTTPAERYGYVFNGSAQNLDHVIVNATMVANAAPMRLEHARINADFGEDNRGDGSIPTRLSDHDPAVAIFTGRGFAAETLIFASGFEAVVGR